LELIHHTAKNLIGAFKEPLFVYIYPEFLHTLDKREFNNGLAEVIKAGFIKRYDDYFLI
jgi:3-dehydroquinate synthetase